MCTETKNITVSLAQESQKYLSNQLRKHGIIDHGKQKKSQVKNWTDREYHAQHNKYFKHQGMRMYCSKSQFTELNFLGKQNTPNDVRGLCKHYHIRFYPKIGHGTYAICRISCACTLYNSSLDQPCIPGFPAQKQPRFLPVKYCTYWPLSCYFNNCNIIKLSHKATASE